MKRLFLYFILSSTLISAHTYAAEASDNGRNYDNVVAQAGKPRDDIDRMDRYNKLNQLFDSALLKYGISDVSSIPSVDAWDFDLFADYVIQEGEETLNLGADTFIKNNDDQTLTILLSPKALKQWPLPADELKISFNGSPEDRNRTLSLTYSIPVTKDNRENIRKECLDLLVDTWKEDEDTELSFAGPYRHLYTIGEDEDSIFFTCRIPVPTDTWYKIPASYVPQISYAQLPENAPCNSGKEPFSRFLEKFNNDAAFRIERRANSDRSNHADIAAGYPAGTQFGFNELVLTSLSESGLLPLHGHYSQQEYKPKTGNEPEEKESCGQWFYPTANSVIYSGWSSDTGNPEKDSSIIILFERIDDEWNTTATHYSGQRLDDTIKRLMQEKYE